MNKKISLSNTCILKYIKNSLSLEQFTNLVYSIEKDSKKFIEDLVKDDVIVHRPDIVSKIEQDDDFANLKVGDFISYHFTKGNNPIKEFIDAYKFLNKSVIPTAGFITGNFKSISFEQIPEHPIGSKCCFYYEKIRSLVSIVEPEKLCFDKWKYVEINFSEKKNVIIKAKNNVIELSL